MSDEKADKAIRVLPFTGNGKDWLMWSSKFLAMADERGYGDILLGDEEAPTDVAYEEIKNKGDAMTSEDKEKLNMYKLNKKAYNDLLLSQENMTCWRLVHSAKENMK